MNVGDILTFEYTGGEQSIMLPAGRYKLEVWGAQGGSYQTYSGGYGGHSTGELSLAYDIPTETEIFVMVGGQPASNETNATASPGGYNGGGAGFNRSYSGVSSYGQGGGGGTDIRIGQNSLYSRVIVAGGGGGSSHDDSKTLKAGGGTEGASPQTGFGGKQTPTTSITNGIAGTFGQGASTTTGGSNYKYGSGGGGGGWYGGAACSTYNDSTNYRGYNGGGSGYIFTSATKQYYPEGCLLLDSHFLSNALTEQSTREGNGKAEITCLELYKFVPDPVTNLRQIVKTKKQIGIQWESVSGATSYKIYKDGAFIRSITTTVFYETFTEYNEAHEYTVTAVDNRGESDPESIYCETELYFDILDLITDRTASDVAALKALIAKGENLTEEEVTRFLKDSKGAYNYSDMNRVALATMFIVSELASIGEIIEVQMKKDWNENNIPKTSEIATYLNTIRKVRDVIKISITNVPNQIRSISDANAIEQMLVDIDNLIKRQLYFLNYSGDLYSGEV